MDWVVLMGIVGFVLIVPSIIMSWVTGDWTLFGSNKLSKWESKPGYGVYYFSQIPMQGLSWLGCRSKGKYILASSEKKALKKVHKSADHKAEPWREYRVELTEPGILKNVAKQRELAKKTELRQVYRSRYIQYLETELDKAKELK